MLKQTSSSTDKIISKAFPNYFFYKALYEQLADSYASIGKTSSKIWVLSKISAVLLTANLLVIYLEPSHTSKMNLLWKFGGFQYFR